MYTQSILGSHENEVNQRENGFNIDVDFNSTF